MSYSDLLKDPRWQRKRLRVLDAAGWKCFLCESTEKTLHVHHDHYKRGAMPWEYEDEDLRVLCEDCHFQISLAKKALDEIVSTCGSGLMLRLSGYAQALFVRFSESSNGLVHNFSENQGLGISDALSEFNLGITHDDVWRNTDTVDMLVDVKALTKLPAK